ncbi:HAD family hydrolase [Arcticibacterium luteifluviistationis]|uniref:Haloacid dehalogenase n=1 Tax=Arcticibacterium luteifluviistationis TaxID=1784714 RepID=A0A2Z4GD35_9BACT|nr:HAD family phosphatase [Arcticibacterium luteifluviistationis]AWV98998.1 haloacid dehalogenase [Arcticibacterium luteifluviistationis]
MENKAVIFDMDGVICHTNPYHSKAFRVFFEKRGLNPTDEEFAEHMFGKSNSYILKHFLGRTVEGEEFTQMEEEKEGLFREIYAEYIETIPGYTDWLRVLKAEGFKTGVATSAPRANLNLIMAKVGFEPMMESILASEDVTAHKPDPQVYLKSANNLGVKPENCIVFEDSHSGVSAAINAGMKVVGVLSSHTKEELPPCDFHINDYSEINLDILNRIR